MAINPVSHVEFLTALLEGAPADLLRVPFEIGPDIQEFANADLAGTVTYVGGPGISGGEGQFDIVQYQLRLRAREHQLRELWETANWLDKYLCREMTRVEAWGTWIVDSGRFGGGPAALQEDTRERRSVACTYFAEVEL